MSSSIELRFLDHARRRNHWNEYGSYVRKGFLTTQATRIIWEGIRKTFEEDSKGAVKKVGLRYLLEYAETYYDKDIVSEVRMVLTRIRAMPPAGTERPVIEFLQRRIAKGALELGIDLLADPEGLQRLSIVRDEFDHAIHLGSQSRKVYSYFGSVADRKTRIREGLIPTGLSPRLDEDALGGGVCAGELCILMGPPGRGKTQALCNIAANAVAAGHNTLYLSLQDESEKKIARRIDQILTGWPEKKIVQRPDEFQSKMEAIQKKAGTLLIKDYLHSSASVYDVRAAVESMDAEGFPPRVVLLDYLDTLVSHTRDQDQNVVFSKIGHELRRMGKERRFPVWTASQGNRESMDVDNVRLSQISGAIAKTRTADLVIGMSQKPSERTEGYMRFEILKTRMNAQHHSIAIFSDEETMRLWGRRASHGESSTGTGQAGAPDAETGRDRRHGQERRRVQRTSRRGRRRSTG